MATLPDKLRKWADNRERLHLDARLLRQAAKEIEHRREQVKEYERERQQFRAE